MYQNGFLEAKRILMIESPQVKVLEVQQFFLNFQKFDFKNKTAVVSIPTPGRPVRPTLSHPSKLKHRRLNSREGRGAMIHAIAHIEFNAINLGLDAVYRFQDMPQQYYFDWLFVANDEAKHFTMLTEHLQHLEYVYGDFNAHNGLWEMACKTEYSCLARMALVPRLLEARGLDVTPSLIQKFENVGDIDAVNILKVIQIEEVEHVAIGNKWFHFLCEKEEKDSFKIFESLLKTHANAAIKPPINHDLREKAGFTEKELNFLHSIIESDT